MYCIAPVLPHHAHSHPGYVHIYGYERPRSRLSENHKINVIGRTVLKLWPFKDSLFNTLGPFHFDSVRVGSVTIEF